MRGERFNALRHRHDHKQKRFYKKGSIKNVEDHLELSEQFAYIDLKLEYRGIISSK